LEEEEVEDLEAKVAEDNSIKAKATKGTLLLN